MRLYIYLFLSFCFFSKSTFALSGQFFANEQGIFEKEYHIAFLLPFCVENNTYLFSEDLDSLIMHPDLLKDYDVYKKTQISLDFFLGFLSSINNFKNVNVKISVFDIQEGEISKDILTDILNQGYLDEVDLVLGPLFTENFVFFSNIFYRDKPIVSPFSKKPHIVYNNTNTFQVPTDIMSQLSVFAKQIFNTHQDDNILLIKRDTILDTLYNKIIGTEDYEMVIDTLVPNDIIYGDIFLNAANNLLLDQGDSLSFQEIKVRSSVIDSVYHKLDTLGVPNIIIIPSEDNVFVTDLLSKLHACRDSGMVVYGLPVLADFDHMSIYDLMDMKVTFPHNKNFNYSEIDDFIIHFHNDYNYLPNLKYASIGYELGVYFLSLLFNYGSIIPFIDYYNPQTVLGTTYDFQKIRNGGYRNNAISILRYENFEYKNLHMYLKE